MPTENFSKPSDAPIYDLLKEKTKTTKFKAYVGCKIIRAIPMSHEEYLKEKGQWIDNQESYGDGYKVIYPDNYISFSPKNVFEQAYREISKGEFGIIDWIDR